MKSTWFQGLLPRVTFVFLNISVNIVGGTLITWITGERIVLAPWFCPQTQRWHEDVTKEYFLNVVLQASESLLRFGVRILIPREPSENITDSHIIVCLLSSILPLTKCPILQAVETSAVPAPKRRTTFRGNKRWDGVIREMPVNGCEAFQLTPSPYKCQSGLLLTMDNASPAQPLQQAAAANKNTYLIPQK